MCIYVYGDGAYHFIGDIVARRLTLNFCRLQIVHQTSNGVGFLMFLISDDDCSLLAGRCYEYNRKRNKYGTTNVVHLRAPPQRVSDRLVVPLKYRKKMTETITLFAICVCVHTNCVDFWKILARQRTAATAAFFNYFLLFVNNKRNAIK